MPLPKTAALKPNIDLMLANEKRNCGHQLANTHVATNMVNEPTIGCTTRTPDAKSQNGHADRGGRRERGSEDAHLGERREIHCLVEDGARDGVQRGEEE